MSLALGPYTSNKEYGSHMVLYYNYCPTVHKTVKRTVIPVLLNKYCHILVVSYY